MTLKMWLDSRSHNIKIYLLRCNFFKEKTMSFTLVIAKGPGGFGHEREVGVAVEGKQEGSLWLWKYSLVLGVSNPS